MNAIFPKDGTKIAYDKTGQGSSLILVAGAFQGRMAMSAYAEPLSKNFTVYNYDRRGRGDSDDTLMIFDNHSTVNTQLGCINRKKKIYPNKWV